jgi:PhzF family phenazine biosynthesis protein
MTIWMDFPAEPVSGLDPSLSVDEEIRNVLRLPTVFVGKNRMDFLVEVESEADVRSADPDLSSLKGMPARGLIVTAKSESDSEYDFVSRFFAPRFGVDEDPVTGSAHCALAPYWSKSLGKKAMVGFQASKRSGLVRVRLKGDRVGLGGEAVTVFSGLLRNLD